MAPSLHGNSLLWLLWSHVIYMTTTRSSGWFLVATGVLDQFHAADQSSALDSLSSSSGTPHPLTPPRHSQAKTTDHRFPQPVPEPSPAQVGARTSLSTQVGRGDTWEQSEGNWRDNSHGGGPPSALNPPHSPPHPPSWDPHPHCRGCDVRRPSRHGSRAAPSAWSHPSTQRHKTWGVL